MVNPLTAEFFWQQFIHFHLTWVCWLPVLQDSTSCHQTYNYSGHDRLHMVNHLSSHKTTHTRRHRPHNLVEPPNLMGFTRFASTACSHKVYSWGAAVRGLPPKLTNWCSLCPCRSHTSAAMGVRSGAPLNPAARGGHHPRAPPMCTF